MLCTLLNTETSESTVNTTACKHCQADYSAFVCRPDEKLKLTFMTNAVGPIIAYKYFRPLLEKGETKMIVNFASNYGSITLASQPLKEPKKATPLDHTQIAYKASKAAVNMGEAFAFGQWIKASHSVTLLIWLLTFAEMFHMY